jgi:hypothetical protein
VEIVSASRFTVFPSMILDYQNLYLSDDGTSVRKLVCSHLSTAQPFCLLTTE